MTIDEAIAHAREVSNRKFDDRVHCIRCSEFYKQLAEWLEELKAYKSDDFTSGLQTLVYKQGYNNAIDDFAEKLSVKCDGMIKDKWNSNVAPISWAEAYADFKDDIEEISEQLKAGGENE